MKDSQAAWLLAVRAELERSLTDPTITPWLALEELRFEGEYPNTYVTIVGREKPHLNILFGFRWGSIADWAEKYGPESPDSAMFIAHVIKENFEEALFELPQDHTGEGVYWI